MAHGAQEFITQEAFSVTPELIGQPLAGPWRRLWAMLLDLALVGILVNVGGAVLLGIAAVFVFLRLSSGRMGSRLRPSVRFAVRGLAALVVFSVSLGLWHRAEKGVEEVVEDAAVMGVTKGAGHSRVLSGLGTGAAFVSLGRAQNEKDARQAAHGLVRQMRGTGMPDADIRSALEDFAADQPERPWLRGVLLAQADSAGLAKTAQKPGAASADSMALAYAQALRAHDTATARAMRPGVGAMLAADSLGRLEARVTRLKTENQGLQATMREQREETEKLQSAGILHLMSTVADELGIGFGWTGLYFTAFLALWKGQTPGKRMLGIRVMRLDGEKIGLWGAFERFGGYAASIFTGLLGFAQIFWDRNRQALHDKIVETVVVRVS
jgi:uncharacterized RDD family membrane protein YckC